MTRFKAIAARSPAAYPAPHRDESRSPEATGLQLLDQSQQLLALADGEVRAGAALRRPHQASEPRALVGLEQDEVAPDEEGELRYGEDAKPEHRMSLGRSPWIVGRQASR
jgi:hypothetical protein